MTYFNDTAVAINSQPRRAAAFFDAIALKLRQRKVYNQTFNELSALTTRDLQDLGLCRGDFRRLSRESAEMVK